MRLSRKIRTYCDSNVLITAWRSFKSSEQGTAFNLLFSPNRQFVASPLLRLETIPTATRNGNSDEVSFYEFFFSRVEWVSIEDAFQEAMNICTGRQGFGNMDALHAASARVGKVDQLITTEKPTKPFFWLTDLNPIHVSDPLLTI